MGITLAASTDSADLTCVRSGQVAMIDAKSHAAISPYPVRLGQPFEAIPPWLKRIVPDGSATIQAIFDYSHRKSRLLKPMLHHARPASIKGQALPS
ncbi:hypothetical protein AYO44_12295 [Planctomycetaceae bacterium SCGC AG-212-F19]|nr:hypothetical protein AYO44_12295 [Planctomycetaceae bacterium SCGC AG-212-F19]